MLYGCLNGKGIAGCILTIVVSGFLVACEYKVDDADADTKAAVSGVSLNGTISIAAGSSADSDVNDPNAAYHSNDSIASAQTIPNPTTLGGYVNVAGFGANGRSFQQGDSNDYYLVQLFSGQTVSINVADYNQSSGTPNRVALFLMDQDGTVVQHTSGERQTDFIDVNTDSIYYLRVLALSGASSYILTTGFSGAAQASDSQLPGNNMDFVPGEVIVEYNTSRIPVNQMNGTRSMAADLASSLGLKHKAGEPGRPMLLSLHEQDGTTNTLAYLGAKLVPQASDPLLRRKLATIETVKLLRKRTDVISARLNYIRHKAAIPNDEFYSYQWHYPQINLPQAWDVTTGNNNVIVAVIDTGVLLDHPDLQGQLVAGYDFIRDAENAADGDGIDNDPYDVGDDPNGNSSFHGTHVSGTIAAASNNINGVAGVAWDAKVMPLRALGRFGGTDYDIEQAVRFAAQLPNDSGTVPPRRADVINLSLGGPGNTSVPPEAYRLARQSGVIIVAAAGNESSSRLNYPASLDGVVSVSATTINLKLAGYSNFGNTIDLAAPGGNFTDVNGDGFADGVLSTVASDANKRLQFGYAFYQGTSMASPHVAGVVALMKSVNDTLTPQQFDQLLSAGEITDDIGTAGRDNQFGYGQINAYKAVTAALNLVDAPLELQPPFAEVQPIALNFGVTGVSMEFSIANAGDGELQVLQINNNSGGWLSIAPLNVDENGLGRYVVQADRELLPQETRTYSVSISVTTSRNTIAIPVLMQVYVDNAPDSAGFLYALLKDSVTQRTIQKVPAHLVNGQYQFRFDNVLPGSYSVSSSSDVDNDGLTCEVAEACGTYLIPTYVIPVVIDELSGGRGGINFEASYENVINSADDQSPLIKLQQFLY